jgi:AcrR family transcriptional regulator
MPILFVTNDPEAKKCPKPRAIAPAGKRGSGKTDFDVGPLPAEKVWPANSDEFLVWQCREAVMRALLTWEKIAGPLAHWQGSARRKKLKVIVDEGEDLNAYYDRDSVGYYHFRSKKTGRLRRFAASVEVVSHEVGHAFLDAMRPELWSSNYPEPNAFHEAFGDCIAILTSLADVDVRKALLKQDPKLSRTNFVETLMESLANGIRDNDAKHNAAKPRHGKNAYRWVLPTTLPDDGGPGVLINEIHSYGQVFVGCFYDTLRNVFAMQARHDQESLWTAAELVGELLARAARKAPHTPRFFQSVGRAMTLEDNVLHGGAHHDAIRDAFGAHDILLGSNAVLAPRTSLKGAAPKTARAAKQPLAKATLDDLRSRLGLSPRAALRMRSYDLGGTRINEAIHDRAVPLKGLSPRLAKVSAVGVEPSMIGESNRHAAVLGALPDAQSTSDEVRSFVASLVRQGAITYDGKGKGAKGAGGLGAVGGTGGAATHGVVRRNGQLMLERLRFSCGCGRRGRTED